MKKPTLAKKQQKQLKIIKKNQESENKIKDARFSKAAYDPKFSTPNPKMTKVKIDKRFEKMMTDEQFKLNSKFDKYGRSVQKSNRNKELQEYYYLDEKEESEKNEVLKQEGEEDMNEGAEEDMNEKDVVDEKQDGIQNWMENYDEESSENVEDMPIDQLIEEDDGGIWSDDQAVVKNQQVQATPKLALCNYDWMNINSKDLMLLFSSLKPSTGYIKNIKIYMSNIGKQNLEAEEKYGPQGIWANEEEIAQQKPNKKKSLQKSWKELLGDEQEACNALNDRKLRHYEKQRLKYFYAIIQCDSKKTADEIYRECDGNQFQNSNLPFDLRFVPNETVFDEQNLTEQCNELPLGGEVKNFVNRALGHSKVSLSWEDPELSLPASLKKKNWGKLSQEELDKMDWGMYINDDELEVEDDFKQIVNQNEDEDQYAHLPDWKRECNKKYRKKEDDIEITFPSGFDSIQTQQPQPNAGIKKEKQSRKEKKLQAQIEKTKQRQHLELLVDDHKELNFQPNLADQRFKAVFQNPMFTIDPVDPKFDHRKSGKVFQELVRRNQKKNLQ